ncbi:UNVERIFIED_CONTAM: hypothetical protein FKN15_076502 [Acipenser sinensis]
MSINASGRVVVRGRKASSSVRTKAGVGDPRKPGRGKTVKTFRVQHIHRKGVSKVGGMLSHRQRDSMVGGNQKSDTGSRTVDGSRNICDTQELGPAWWSNSWRMR